ncbi:MAG TPA: exodeoxyribonuclease VII large subunit [Clostridiales bacterium]|nr:exodeoxyribonuclease VII large subunit [Clostridiales bacterium]
MRTYSVFQVTSYLKNVIDSEELLKNIIICGEISNFKVTGPNAYFTLKDEQAQIPCVFFEYVPQFLIKEGDKVYCQGSPSFYIRGGRLSFIVNKIDVAGEGEEYLKLLRLKEKLKNEGLFDLKIPFPKHIKKIGVITSAEGAAIYDIISVVQRRDKSVNIAVYPVRVQGIGAEYEIVDAIKQLENYESIDCILVARGGGSYEDLSAFNTEEVARAVAMCKKFVVSAVGHETDYTLCDFSADLRAPTPSAAAEVLTKNTQEIVNNIKQKIKYLAKSLSEFYSYNYTKLNYSFLRLGSAAESKLYRIRDKILSKVNKLQSISFFNDKHNLYNQAFSRLKSNNPKKILSLGYAKVYKDGKSVNSARDVRKGDEVTMFFKDGKVNADIL